MASLELMYQCTVCFFAGPTMEALLHHEYPGLGLIGKYLVMSNSNIYSEVHIHWIESSGTATYRGLRPNGTTFYQSEIPLLLPSKFPGLFPKWKAPPASKIIFLIFLHSFIPGSSQKTGTIWWRNHSIYGNLMADSNYRLLFSFSATWIHLEKAARWFCVILSDLLTPALG